MNLEILGPAFSFVCLAVTIVIVFRIKRAKLVYITDFQAGLRFRGGAHCTVLPPGSYLSSVNRNPITLVDMRPNHFIFERMAYKDTLLRNFVISISGELQVRDPELAVSASKNLVDDALAIFREGLRVTASNSIVDPSAEGRAKLTATVTAELNRQLGERGVEIQNLEITELWAPSFKPSISATAN